jgi:hypothetical protein
MPKDHRDKPKHTVEVVKYYPMGPRAGETRPKKGGGELDSIFPSDASRTKAAEEIINGTCQVGGRKGGAYASVEALKLDLARSATGRSLLREVTAKGIDMSVALGAENASGAIGILNNLIENGPSKSAPAPAQSYSVLGKRDRAPMATGKHEAVSGPLQVSPVKDSDVSDAVNKIVSGLRALDKASSEAAGKVLGQNVKKIIVSLAATGGLAAAGACGALVAAPSLIVAASIAIPEFAKAFQANPKSDLESLIKTSRTKWQEQRDKLFEVAQKDSDMVSKKLRSSLDTLSSSAPKLPLPEIVEKASSVLNALDNYFKTFFSGTKPTTDAAVAAIEQVTTAVTTIAAAPAAAPAEVTAAAAVGMTLPGNDPATPDAMKEGGARRTRHRRASGPRRTRRSSFGRRRGGSHRRRE